MATFASHANQNVQSSNGGFLTGVADFFRILGSAIEVTRALEFKRRPADADLQILGIDSQAFASLRR